MVDKYDAPDGYIAVYAAIPAVGMYADVTEIATVCDSCAFTTRSGECNIEDRLKGTFQPNAPELCIYWCYASSREDRVNVIFLENDDADDLFREL